MNTILANNEFRLKPSSDLITAINQLRIDRKAVILAHYYQNPEIQDLADFIGDSLQLSQAAVNTNAEVIVFCGVHFMAETAKILNPEKRVIIPDVNAGCSLSDMCSANALSDWLKSYPDHVVISYINCSAQVKALSDIICTSSNAEQVVRSVPPEKNIVFIPDRHLGRWIMGKTGRDMVLWPGVCIVHEQFILRRVVESIAANPDAKLIVHPECDISISQLADFVGSTAAMLSFISTSSAKKFIIGTESGILHQMRKIRPDAEFLPVPIDSDCNCSLCPYMKLNTLEKLHDALLTMQPEIYLDEQTRLKAIQPITRMLAIK